MKRIIMLLAAFVAGGALAASASASHEHQHQHHDPTSTTGVVCGVTVDYDYEVALPVACPKGPAPIIDGGFLSYGTPDVIPFQTEAQGDLMLRSGYTLPYCSHTPNPYNIATYGKWHLWGVVPAGEKATGGLGDASGSSTFTGGVAAVLALHAGFCWITA